MFVLVASTSIPLVRVSGGCIHLQCTLGSQSGLCGPLFTTNAISRLTFAAVWIGSNNSFQVCSQWHPARQTRRHHGSGSLRSSNQKKLRTAGPKANTDSQ